MNYLVAIVLLFVVYILAQVYFNVTYLSMEDYPRLYWPLKRNGFKNVKLFRIKHKEPKAFSVGQVVFFTDKLEDMLPEVELIRILMRELHH